MPRKFYTIDDLKQFCRVNNFASFSSQQYGAPLIIHSIETFESADNSKDGLLDVKLKSCHIDRNRNGSFISEDNMNAYKHSFKGRPILASIIKTDTGDYEFHSHDMTLDEDGNLEYIEQPVGVISQLKEPYLEYDKEQDKTYLMVEGHIFEDYSKAAEILQRRKTCRCSVEIAVEEMSYNAAEDYLSIDKFSFRGVTILGYEQDGETVIQEGMEGSRITIDDFSAEQNSMFSENHQDKLIETLEKLNETLSMFTINNNTNQEEVSKEMGHFEELLEKYSVEREAIDFEFEGLSDEELDAIFEEKFGEVETTEEVVEEVAEEEFEEGSEEEELTEEEVEEEVSETETEEFSVEDIVVSFRISHEDVKYGLQNLLNSMNGDSHYYVVDSVYDKYFYYVDWMTPNMDAFRQAYKTRKDALSFDGDAEPVYRDFVTQAERDELEKMRKNYAELKAFKDNYDATELKALKDAIFGREEFSVLAEDEAFIELKNTMDNFTVEEIESKAKQIFADHVIKNGQFAMNKDAEPKQSKKIGFNYTESSKKKSAYGGLFDE
jgi:hypothetical protein